jgi:hypothetical protein
MIATAHNAFFDESGTHDEARAQSPDFKPFDAAHKRASRQSQAVAPQSLPCRLTNRPSSSK